MRVRKNVQHGSINDLMNEIQKKLSTNEIEESTSVKAASESDETFNERYLHSLIGDIQTEVGNEINKLVADYGDDDLRLIITYESHVIEMTITFDELSFDFDQIEDDAIYIGNSIREMLDNLGEDLMDGEYWEDNENMKILSSTTSSEKSEYLSRLTDQVTADLGSSIDDINVEYEDDSIFIDVTYTSGIRRNFVFSYSELSFNFDEIESDIQYIINTILYDTDTYDDSVDNI